MPDGVDMKRRIRFMLTRFLVHGDCSLLPSCQATRTSRSISQMPFRMTELEK